MYTYTAELEVKLIEQDDYNHGCLPNTAQEVYYTQQFSAESLAELLHQISEYHSVAVEDMNFNECDELGRLDIQCMEDDNGLLMFESEKEQWKQGKKQAWLATYTYYVSRCEPVDISEEYDRNS